MSLRILLEASPNAFNAPETYVKLDNVVGHVLVTVVHGEDGNLSIERCVGVNVEDHPEDGETVTAFIQGVEKKLNEALPESEATPKIWLPE